MKSRMNNIVVKLDTISTTNITGLRIMRRGLSFLKASPIAGQRIFGSVIEVDVRLRAFSMARGLETGMSMVSDLKRVCRHSSRNARRWDRARARGNR